MTEPVKVFLNTRKYNRARTSESSILRLTATSVRKTLSSAFLTNPLKKTSIAVKAISVKAAVNGMISFPVIKEGENFPSPVSNSEMTRAKINKNR